MLSLLKHPELEPMRKVLQMEIEYFNTMLSRVRASVAALIASTTAELHDEDDEASIATLAELAAGRVPGAWCDNSQSLSLAE